MKKLTTLIIMLLVSVAIKAQITKDPVSWICKMVKMKDHKYKIYIEATIQNGWHIYSQHQPNGAISVPTSFQIISKDGIKAIGKMRENGKLKKQEIQVLGISQNFYAKKVEFVQDVSVPTNKRSDVIVKISYMACNEQSCLPLKEKEIRTQIK